MQIKNLTLRKELSIVDGFCILFGTFLLLNVLIGGGIFPVQLLAGWLPGGATAVNQLLVQQMLQVAIMVGLTLLFLYKLRGGTLRQLGLRPFANRRWMVWSILLGLATFLVMMLLITILASLFPQWAQPQAVTNVITQAQNRWEWVAALLVVSVLAPFSEELLFRGYIYQSLRNRYSVPFSVLMTSLLFGCIHYDLFRLLPLTLVGVAMNLVAIRSRSLWGSILMHGTWNFSMTMLLLLV